MRREDADPAVDDGRADGAGGAGASRVPSSSPPPAWRGDAADVGDVPGVDDEPGPPADPVAAPPPVPGSGSGWGGSDAAGQRIDEGRGRTFPCHACGADLEYHIGESELACSFCGARRAIELDPDAVIAERDLRAELVRQAALRTEAARVAGASGAASAADGRAGETGGGRGGIRDGGRGDAPTADDAIVEIRCDACGADVAFDRTLSSTECAFCGSPLQREDAHTAVERVPVDGVLPFAIAEGEARVALARWVRSRWFAPTEFRRRGVRGRFNGVYLPFWTFDSHTATSYRGMRGDHYWVTVGSGKNRRRVRRTRWRPVSGRFERFFDDVLVLASEGQHRALVRGLEPWPLAETRPFDRRFLAGFLARTYDVELADGFDLARDRIDEALRADVRRRIGGDEQRVTHMRSTYEPVTYKHLLLPLWLLAYRWGDRTFQVVVNARTGEVQGERPWSWVKITLAVLAGLAVVGGIVWLRSRMV